MIALVDYGAGNLTSVVKALAHVGARVEVVRQPEPLARARAIVVPGVGHFGATAALDARWKQAVRDAVAGGRPLLGICLGMQWLYDSSAEAPGVDGLGAIHGRSERLPDAGVKVPHVGWNALRIVGTSWILDGVQDGDQVYFTHSFAPPITGETVATTEHGAAFTSVVEQGHVAGVQFHPEKSSDVGLTILHNFVQRTGRG